ncbi:serine hydrolase domain-containing protein [Dyadobacter psychrotolerans]|uniref:Class A beta-lactamase-related serine hydrolase n=1 Tax=Dyadobacter psychrotolerans TaxID=2541721 RepID=A0A4R5DX80_9BACT|nr:serine hydrolase domain-containing protein [Dyadobacter psychrotolerans]TDE17254.1 class A beta-lactamase-related serine hydrolase [Dyadobacter psychrotolerans]
MRFPVLAICFLASAIHFAFSQPYSYIDSVKYRQLDSIASQDVPAHAPGIATGIVRNGQIVYSKYFGYANLSDSVQINEHSRFNIASNAKQFTALAILLLVKQQKISLDDDIRKFLPDLYTGIKHKILIKHLLNHSSGIRDIYDLWSVQGIVWWKTILNNQDALQLLQKQKELNFKPGTTYLYSNSNYILLAQIIEKVTGESFVNYTKNLFTKLDMPHTAFVDNHKKIDAPIAKPYFNFNQWVNYDWLCDIHGDGNLFTTLTDQLQWEKIIQLGHHDSIPTGLIKKSQQLTGNSEIKEYGYGLEFGAYKGIQYRFHEGATGAWKATLLRFPKDSLSVITLTNSGKTIPATQTRQMADILLNLSAQTPLVYSWPNRNGTFASASDIVGIYTDNKDFSFQFEQRDSIFYLKRFGRNEIQLVRESDNVFHQTNDPTFKMEFIKDKKSKLQVTAYHPSHAPYTLDKVDYDWENFDFRRMSGKFQNDETKQFLLIEYLSGQTFNIKLGDNETNGILITPTKLLSDGFQLAIQNNIDLNTVYFNMNRVKNLRFDRIK